MIFHSTPGIIWRYSNTALKDNYFPLLDLEQS